MHSAFSITLSTVSGSHTSFVLCFNAKSHVRAVHRIREFARVLECLARTCTRTNHWCQYDTFSVVIRCEPIQLRMFDVGKRRHWWRRKRMSGHCGEVRPTCHVGGSGSRYHSIAHWHVLFDLDVMDGKQTKICGGMVGGVFESLLFEGMGKSSTHKNAHIRSVSSDSAQCVLCSYYHQLLPPRRFSKKQVKMGHITHRINVIKMILNLVSGFLGFWVITNWKNRKNLENPMTFFTMSWWRPYTVSELRRQYH